MVEPSEKPRRSISLPVLGPDVSRRTVAEGPRRHSGFRGGVREWLIWHRFGSCEGEETAPEELMQRHYKELSPTRTRRQVIAQSRE